MTVISALIKNLQSRGWTLAAIGDEVGVGRVSVKRWRDELTYPVTPKPIIEKLERMLEQETPKKKRYPGTHHLQKK